MKKINGTVPPGTVCLVVLERGPKKNIRYAHTNMGSAKRQAMSLCNLHNCGYTESPEVIRVHASAWYGGK